jgi:hypothetical protein
MKMNCQTEQHVFLGDRHRPLGALWMVLTGKWDVL